MPGGAWALGARHRAGRRSQRMTGRFRADCSDFRQRYPSRAPLSSRPHPRMRMPNADYRLYYWPEIQGRERPSCPRRCRRLLRCGQISKRPRRRDGGAFGPARTQGYRRPRSRRQYCGMAISTSAKRWPSAAISRRHGLMPSGAGRWKARSNFTHDCRLCGRDPRHPSPHRGIALLRRTERGGAPTFGDISRGALTKFLGYFERVLAHNTVSDGRWLVGGDCSRRLSLFQVITGLEYAFPNALAAVEAVPSCSP